MAYQHSLYAWKDLARRFKAHCKAVDAPCFWCVLRGDQEHARIDYLGKGPWSFEADHIEPVDVAPARAFAWSNCAPSHKRCNRAKGNKPVDRAVPQTWVVPDW